MHVVCPQCGNAIETVVLSLPHDISCPACGSTFRLDPGVTLPFVTLKKVGKFEVLNEVGAGSFGTVYRARDPELDRTVAIKVPRASNLGGSDDVGRFLREARSVAQLRHPGIVSVHEVGQHEGMTFLVSDFVEGITLADLLTARRPTFQEAAELIARVAAALQYAHDQGVIHRDVKPSNIMLELPNRPGERSKEQSRDLRAPLADLNPRLMDFGLAKRDAGETTMTMDGQVLGTPAYMSPEQARGQSHAVDGRSDVYSLGVVLYQLLTGELPFRGNTQMLLFQVMHEEPRPPRTLNHRIPRDLETICLTCLQKDPNKRYPRAQDLTADLRRWLGNEPIQARPVGRLEKLWRWSRRNPKVAILTASVVLLLALITAGTSLAAFLLREERNQVVGLNQDLASTNTQLQEAQEEEKKARERAEEREKAGRRHLYTSRISWTQQALEIGQIERARNLLLLSAGEGPEDLRGFEWYYLWSVCQRASFALRGHNGPVSSVAFAPDGEILVTGSYDKTIKVWQTRTGQELATLTGHAQPVTCVVFLNDGKVASGSLDFTVKVWDVSTRKEHVTLSGGKKGINSLAASSNGSMLAAGRLDGTFDIWDLQTQQVRFTQKGHKGAVHSLAFAPDGETLATAGADGSVKYWRAASGESLTSFQAHGGVVAGLAFSRDGQTLATAGMWDRTIRLWDVRTRKGRLTIPGYKKPGHSNRILCLAFAPDGKTLATAGAETSVKLWDVATGQFRGETKELAGVVLGLAFSPDSQVLATARDDETAKLWDGTTAEVWQPLQKQDGVGKRLPLHVSSGFIWSVKFSADGKMLAASHGSGGIPGSGSVTLWDAASGKTLPPLAPLSGPTSRSVAFSPDNKALAVGSQDGTTKVCDLATGNLRYTLKQKGTISSVSFSPDGAYLATGSNDGMVKLWDPDTGKEKSSFKAHETGFLFTVFSADSMYLATSSFDHTVKVWDLETGRAEHILRGHSGWVTSAAFSPDGKTLATSGGIFDHTVKLWDLTTGQVKFTLKGHTDSVNTVAFSPDGKTLASGSEDFTVKLWDPHTGFEWITMKELTGPVLSIAFSPDGKTLVAGGGLVTEVKVWETAN